MVVVFGRHQTLNEKTGDEENEKGAEYEPRVPAEARVSRRVEFEKER